MIVGIDPGKNGGFAWGDPALPHALAMPDTEGDIRDALHRLIADEGVTKAYIEHVPFYVPMPQSVPTGKQVSTAAKLFDSFGFIKGFMASSRIPVVLVRPQKWQADLGIGVKGKKTSTQWKNQLKEVAQRLFPAAHVTLSTADALLIFDWGVRHP